MKRFVYLDYVRGFHFLGYILVSVNYKCGWGCEGSMMECALPGVVVARRLMIALSLSSYSILLLETYNYDEI